MQSYPAIRNYEEAAAQFYYSNDESGNEQRESDDAAERLIARVVFHDKGLGAYGIKSRFENTVGSVKSGSSYVK